MFSLLANGFQMFISIRLNTFGIPGKITICVTAFRDRCNVLKWSLPCRVFIAFIFSLTFTWYSRLYYSFGEELSKDVIKLRVFALNVSKENGLIFKKKKKVELNIFLTN